MYDHPPRRHCLVTVNPDDDDDGVNSEDVEQVDEDGDYVDSDGDDDHK